MPSARRRRGVAAAAVDKVPRTAFHAAMTPAFGRLGYLGILRLTGADVVPFLQGQLTNDMRRLSADQCLLAALCNPQGRILALLRVWQQPSEVLCLLPRELIAPVGEALRKYVLRAKVRIAAAGEELAVAGSMRPEALRDVGLSAPAPGHHAHDAGITRVGIAQDASRHWIIGSESALRERLGPGIDAGAEFELRWRGADIEAGLPQVYAATREAFIPQMLNLDLLDAISFSKGCYTGQEIVARTQHLGRIKRRLFRVDLAQAGPEIGAVLKLPDGRSGRIAESASIADRHLALAVMNLEPAVEAEGAAASTVQGQASLPAYMS